MECALPYLIKLNSLYVPVVIIFTNRGIGSLYQRHQQVPRANGT